MTFLILALVGILWAAALVVRFGDDSSTRLLVDQALADDHDVTNTSTGLVDAPTDDQVRVA